MRKWICRRASASYSVRENDRDRLFEEVDRKTAVPLIPEFRDYVLDELERRGILKRLQVISLREKLGRLGTLLPAG